MTLDLLALLGGRRAEDHPRPDRADVVTTLRCRCGTAVALLARSGGETWLWRAAYRHTPRGAAVIVTDAALADVDAILREHADDEGTPEAVATVEAVARLVERATDDELAAVLPPLQMPAELLRVSGLAAFLADEHARRPEGVAPPRPGGMLAGCGRCRRVVDAGPVVAELEADPNPPPVVVVDEPPPLGMEGHGYEWPSSARSARVVLYQSLCAVLG